MHSEVIRALHDSPWQGSVALTGGGSLLIGRLCTVPGASHTLLEAVVPYERAALQSYLNSTTDQPCTSATARALAARAFGRALKLTADNDQLFGLGCTASLRSEPPKRGKHRFHIALQTTELTTVRSVVLEKDKRSRDDEEQLVADVCLAVLAEYLNLPEILPETEAALDVTDQIENSTLLAPPAWGELLAGKKQAINALEQPDTPAERQLIFSGAFNPFHTGHLGMMRHAELTLGQKTAFELCVNNPDKAMLDYQSIAQRLEQLPAEHSVWLTALPTFLQKCRQFPKTTFLIGIDTAVRIPDSTYYSKGNFNLQAIVDEMKALECDFLVYGRQLENSFLTIENADLPATFRSLCRQVPETDFRQDLSSTTLRTNQSQS